MTKARQILLVTLVATAMVGDARASERVVAHRSAEPACDSTSAAGRMLGRLRETLRRSVRPAATLLHERLTTRRAAVRPALPTRVCVAVFATFTPDHFRLPPPLG